MCSERSTLSATYFEEEVLPHLPALRRVALSLVREPTAAEDYRKIRRTPVMMELDDSTHAARARQTESETALTDETVLQAIEELRPEFRQALLLSDLEGLSLEEISRRMGIPVGTAKSRIFRARRQARTKLQKHALAMGYLTHRSPESSQSHRRRVA